MACFLFASDSLGVLLGSTVSAKAVTAQNWSSRRRLEWNTVGLATLVASNLKSLALSAWSSGTTKTGPARVTTRLTAFRVSQIAFLVILLLALGKGKGTTTFRAHDFDVWHDFFLHESGNLAAQLSLLLGAPSAAFPLLKLRNGHTSLEERDQLL